MQAGDVLLGKYRVERVLGSGGMGHVLAVRHVELDELFAMKLMHEKALTSSEAIERFLGEARAAARLKGEHIARVHDVGRLENGAPYMLMEHLVGDDLSAIIDKRGALPVHEASEYVLQACEALSEAHGRGIVHRDLKPANLFLTGRANGTPCIKVLDFGISKKIDPTAKFGPKLTVTGAFMGTPAFMSPEQMLNGKTVDTRTDIWALGAILYELTTGALPFYGESMTELVARVMHDPATPPSKLRPEIPRAFDTVVLTCLEKRPVNRYQSIDELMAALRPFAAKERPQPAKAPAILRLPRVDDGPESEQPTRVANPRPENALPIVGVHRIDEGPESEQPTRVANPRVNKAPPIVVLPLIDESPESEQPTRVVKPVPRAVDRPPPPIAGEAALNTTLEYKGEVTEQFRIPAAARISSSARKAAKSSSRVLLAIGGVVAIAIAGIALALASESAPSNPDGDTPNPTISSSPEIAIKPEPTPSASASSNASPPTTTSTTGFSGKKSGAGTKPPPITPPPAPKSTSKRPSLYLGN